MIYDILSNAGTYAGLNAKIDQVLEIAAGINAENFPAERIVVDGENVFINAARYETHGADTAMFEAHRQYVDVFVMVEGSETVYVKNTGKLSNVTKEYDPAIDALLAGFDADAMPVVLNPGSVLILYPQDAHAPACNAEAPCKVKKLIGKVRID